MLAHSAGATVIGASDYAAQSRTTAVPREIGWLERLSGLNSGLQEIDGRIAQFRDRLMGSADSAKVSPQPAPVGIDGTLSEAEQRIRSILQALGEINSAF